MILKEAKESLLNLSLSPVKKDRKGFALIMVIWLIVIMSIFGIGVARVSYTNYRFTKLRVDKFLSLNAMNAVLTLTKADRINDMTPGYDSSAEFPQDVEYICGDVKVIYSLTDEERRVNINTATSSVLKDLNDLGMTKAVAITSSELRPFAVKEEILLIDEIKKEDYDGIKGLITVCTKGPININTCSEEMLEALGMKDGLISLIMRFRKGQDGELYTGDDGVFQSKDAIADALKENYNLTLEEEQALISFVSKNMLGVRSENCRIDADVYVSGRVVDRYNIVTGIKKEKNRYYIKEWRRH